MVIYKVTPSLTFKSGDGVECEEGQGHQFISQGHGKCHPSLKYSALARIQEDMETKNSPVVHRRSFKYIERNVVQRRTQVFETDQGNDVSGENHVAKNKMAVPNRPIPPVLNRLSRVSGDKGGATSESTGGLTVAERAKLFNDGDRNASNGGDSFSASTRKLSSDDASSAKPPVSPKKPSIAKKPAVPNAETYQSAGESETVPPKKPVKPERPPAPQLKHIQEVSSQSPNESRESKEALGLFSSEGSNRDSEDPSIPKYAKVNKKPNRGESESAPTDSDNTKKVFLENITLKPVEKKLAETVVSSASIQPSSAPTRIKAVPPPKPPRTFAHDEYLAVRATKGKDKGSRTMSCVASFEVGESGRPSHIYEEIKSVYDVGDGRLGAHDTHESESPCPEPVIYEKVQDVVEDRINVKKQVRTNDQGYSYCTVENFHNEDDNNDDKRGKFLITRPAPPPPRPPQPSPGGRRDSSPLIRINKHSANLDDRDVVRKKHITNPGYEKQPDFIPIKTFRSPTGELKRYKSDECLYAEVNEDGPSDRKQVSFSDDSGSPIYQDPADIVRPHRSASTVMPPGKVPATDSEGYAIPDTRRHTYHRQTSEGPWHPPNHKFSTLQHSRTPNDSTPSRFSRNWNQVSIRRRKVREKVSRAYSVLRKRPTLDELAENVQEVDPDDGYVPYEPAGVSTEFPGAGCFGMLSSDDQDSDVDMEEHKRRLKHVNSLKEKTYNAVNWTMSMKRCRFAKLFHYSLVVGLKKIEDQNTYQPYIIASFPLKEQEQVENILNFCFPDADSWRPVTHYNSESYCFVLTHGDGSRQYGYCRRILPPGDANRLPEVYCVVSPIGAFNMYEQLMQKVESLRKQSPEYPQLLLKAAFARTFPDPGQEAWINLKLDEKRQTVILKRSLDEKLDSVSFGPLLSHLGIDVLLKVYASILLERRIIFTAQHLGTLSTCIQGIISLFYPFTWQHIYIPVLPAALIEICCSPTPFIIGILSTSVPKLQDLPLDEVLIVDLDNNNLLRTIGDEAKIIPRKIQRALVTSLKDDSDVQSTKDTVVFEAFLRLFVETMGHYADCISTQQDGKSVFQKDLFCRAVTSKSIRMFLEWFVETQMFEVFITVRTEQGVPEDGYFERRVMEYREEMAAESNKFKDNVKQLGKKMISFVRESGGKIKKAFGGSSQVYV